MRNKKQSAHRKFTISPRLRYGAISTAIVALVIAALILINLATTNLETRYGWRGDFSFNAVTTQSETTKQILHDLKRPVKITPCSSAARRISPCWSCSTVTAPRRIW